MGNALMMKRPVKGGRAAAIQKMMAVSIDRNNTRRLKPFIQAKEFREGGTIMMIGECWFGMMKRSSFFSPLVIGMNKNILLNNTSKHIARGVKSQEASCG